MGNGFTGYDDGEYVVDNVHVRTGVSGENVAWALTAAHSNNWHPLTWISHALDATMFGLNPTGHHLTSLLLHIANTVLLFLWLERRYRPRTDAAPSSRWVSDCIRCTWSRWPGWRNARTC